MILFYEGLNLHRVKAGPGGIFSFAFSPGKNEVPDDAWAAFIDPEKGSIGVKVMLEEEKLPPERVFVRPILSREALAQRLGIEEA